MFYHFPLVFFFFKPIVRAPRRKAWSHGGFKNGPFRLITHQWCYLLGNRRPRFAGSDCTVRASIWRVWPQQRVVRLVYSEQNSRVVFEFDQQEMTNTSEQKPPCTVRL
jgi:hypothetical protein